MKKTIRIGSGAGFAGDRIEPAVLLAEKGNLDYLVLECLAERTIALAQQRKLLDPELGYDPMLCRRIEALLPHIVANNVCLITNMGAANPRAAAQKIQSIAAEKGYSIRVAAVEGDDVWEQIQAQKKDLRILENGQTLDAYDIVSANAYLGVEGILDALQAQANIIISGRVADPSLFLAPMIHAFGWEIDDFSRLGAGTVVGHLLECAGQLCGGYYADAHRKPVHMPELLGFPFADVDATGEAVLGKLAGTGGEVSLGSVKEQLLYEVIDPNAYVTPDVTADFTQVYLEKQGKDQVAIRGAMGKSKPSHFKVSVGYRAGFVGEGEISYAGEQALARAQLAGETIRKRIEHTVADLRVDYIGWDSVHRKNFRPEQEPYEVRLRVAAKTRSMEAALGVGEEVEALYTNGPAGGGGVRKYAQAQIGIVSVLLPREDCPARLTLFDHETI